MRPQRTSGDARPKALRHFLVPDKHFHIVDLFSPDGPGERQLLGRKWSCLIGKKAAESLRPLGRSRRGATGAEHFLGHGSEEKEFALRIRDDNGIANTC